MIILQLLQKLNLKVTAIVVAFLILASSTYFLYNKNVKLQQELQTNQQNIEAYQGIIAGSNEQNKVLKLEIDQLSGVNDSLLHRADSLFGELVKVKAKLSQVSVITQIVKETVHDTLSIPLPDSIVINKQMVLNDLTKIALDIRKDSITVDLDIRNELYLWVYTRRQYKNQNKKFCKRLLTLDFKKINVSEYKIHNTNPIIKTGPVRVVEIITK